MAMSLRPLGWMATLFACTGALYLYYAQPAMGRALVIAFAVAGLVACSLLTLLDALARRDLDARQRALWVAVGLLTPVGPGVYYVLRRRAAQILHRAEPERRERLPSAYRVHDPFHRH